jgi:xanthine/CO dehydrogenase XdhC/CoxF family maturation factor
MRELLEIIDALEHLPPHAGPAVLATLVKVAGSAYSGPGARLLVLPDANVAGSLGAGCFEKDLAGHGERIRGAGAPDLVTYDLTTDDDKPWGLGLGCHGKLELLLEPVVPGRPPEHLAFLAEAAVHRQAAAVATLFRTGGDPALPLGARLLLRADGRAAGRLLHGRLGAAMLEEARAALAEGRSRLCAHRAAGGEAEVLLEYVPPPIALVLCGDGRDTAPLARLGAELGWHVTLVAKDALPTALDDRTAAVVMSHNYERDLALLAALLPSPARYVGILGARVRTKELLADLAQRGPAPTRAQLARLRAPVGLDVGAETPPEVAVSVAAEVLAVMSGRRGGPLADRKGPIHDRP